MKISAINLLKMRIGLALQFFTEVYDLIIKVDAEKLGIAKQFYELFVPQLRKVDEAVKKIKKSLLTGMIHEMDSNRDNALIGILEVIKGYLRHYNEDIAMAAKNLLILFNTFGNITQKPINEQTALLDNLLTKLEGEYAEDCEKIKIDDWVAELRAMNKKFDALIKQRDDEKAVKSDVILKDSRIKLDEYYKIMCALINALAAVEKDSPIYADFIKRLNVVISRYNNGKRQSASAGDSEPTTPTEPTDPYPNAREWSADIDYQTCASGDIFYIVRNGVKEYYKLLDFGEVATFEPGMDDGGIWEKLE